MRTRLIGFCLVVLAACGGSHPLTLRAVCESIGNAVCARAAECTPPGQSSCAQTFVQTCCTGANCDMDVTDQGAQGQLDKCVADFKSFPCADLANGDYPASCQ
jgi:hypothetical protein